MGIRPDAGLVQSGRQSSISLNVSALQAATMACAPAGYDVILDYPKEPAGEADCLRKPCFCLASLEADDGSP